MKRYVLTTLKVLLTAVLIFSAARLASLGAGLVRDRENLKQIQELKGITEAGSPDIRQPVTGDSAASAGSSAVAPGVTTAGNSAVAPGVATAGSSAAGPDAASAGSSAATDGKADGPVSAVSAATRGSENAGSDVEILTVTPVNAQRFAALSRRNPDFAGWIKIDGTAIDYPVMYAPKDADFYLHHDFDKNESSSGVPYIGKDCGPESDNVILYAHNMKNGTMFAGLLKYADEGYFKNHPVVSFDTLEGDGTYDIIAVFREQVHYRDETNVFRYYNYCGKLTEPQFREYMDQIRAHSLYDTGKTAQYGQQLLTLSTCSYHTENGRFVVVAAKRCVKTGM
ncbi:MAG: class B sortase [Eubacteriales bacterium]|nr:class B sortase [Eubacteriales bacterium]